MYRLCLEASTNDFKNELSFESPSDVKAYLKPWSELKISANPGGMGGAS